MKKALLFLIILTLFSCKKSETSTTTTASANKPNWSKLGEGLNGRVNSLVTFNNELYVGGSFTKAGNISANNIAKWNGTNWSAVASGLNAEVYSLIVYKNALYASFNGGVSKWDGTTWSILNQLVYENGYTGEKFINATCFAVINDSLYTGGQFDFNNGMVEKFDGITWSIIKSGMDCQVYSLAVYNNSLIAGGCFNKVDGNSSIHTIAKWDGNKWSALGAGIGGSVFSIAVLNGYLYVGGNFDKVNGILSNGCARWNGTDWVAFGTGMYNYNQIRRFTVFNGSLYASGYSDIWKLNGNIWANAGTFWDVGGNSVGANCLAEYNGMLYAGGYFEKFDTVVVNNIAKMDN